MRRAWLAYKQRKEEKRKAKEAADAAKKAKRGRFGRTTKPVATANTAIRAMQSTSSPTKQAGATAGAPALAGSTAVTKKDGAGATATSGLDLTRSSVSEAVPQIGGVDDSSLNDRDPLGQTMQPTGVPEEMIINEERDEDDPNDREEDGEEGASESPDMTTSPSPTKAERASDGSPDAEEADADAEPKTPLFELQSMQ